MGPEGLKRGLNVDACDELQRAANYAAVQQKRLAALWVIALRHR